MVPRIGGMHGNGMRFVEKEKEDLLDLPFPFSCYTKHFIVSFQSTNHKVIL